MTDSRRYTGIVRTLPVDRNMTGERFATRVLYRKVVSHFFLMNREPETAYWLMALPSVPTIEVLHCYVLFGGRVRWRLNIADYWGPGSRLRMDGKPMYARAWALCTAPVVRAPLTIEMRGFQGFRYTEALW